MEGEHVLGEISSDAVVAIPTSHDWVEPMIPNQFVYIDLRTIPRNQEVFYSPTSLNDLGISSSFVDSSFVDSLLPPFQPGGSYSNDL